MSMDTTDLDHLYSPSRWSVRFPTAQEVLENHVQSVITASHAALKKIPHILNIEYGPTPRQKLDIFGTDLPNDAPILVYVHGGFWQELCREQSRYTVQPLYRNQIKTIVIGYELCPTVTLAEIVKQIEDAVKFVFNYAQKHGSSRLYFVGHSAGAHLLAMVFSNAHLIDNLKNSNILQGIILISGVYDLRELVKTYVNNAVKLSQESAITLSPIFKSYGHLRCTKVRIHVIVGLNESPVFKHESKQFYDFLFKDCSYENTFLDIKKNYDHFDIVESLSDDDNYLQCLLLDDLRNNVL